MLDIDYGRHTKDVLMDLVRNSGKGGPGTIRTLAVVFALQDAKSDDERTIRALTANLQIPKPAVVRAVDTLVRSGYAKRRRCQKDGRSIFVDLIVREEATAPQHMVSRK